MFVTSILVQYLGQNQMFHLVAWTWPLSPRQPVWTFSPGWVPPKSPKCLFKGICLNECEPHLVQYVHLDSPLLVCFHTIHTDITEHRTSISPPSSLLLLLLAASGPFIYAITTATTTTATHIAWLINILIEYTNSTNGDHRFQYPTLANPIAGSLSTNTSGTKSKGNNNNL